MAKLEQPLYIKNSDEPYDVLMFGKPPPLVFSDLQNGFARFGGSGREPNYLYAYFLAAKVLIEYGIANNALDEIALPAFYMQRHTTELVLKEALSLVYDIADYKLKLGRENQAKISKHQRERQTSSHNIEELSQDLLDTTKELGLPQPPSELQCLIESIKCFEKSNVWARYATTKKRDGRVVENIHEEVIVPIVTLQNDLRTIIDKIQLKTSGEEDNTYMLLLYREWESLAHEAGDLD